MTAYSIQAALSLVVIAANISAPFLSEEGLRSFKKTCRSYITAQCFFWTASWVSLLVIQYRRGALTQSEVNMMQGVMLLQVINVSIAFNQLYLLVIDDNSREVPSLPKHRPTCPEFTLGLISFSMIILAFFSTFYKSTCLEAAQLVCKEPFLRNSRLKDGYRGILVGLIFAGVLVPSMLPLCVGIFLCVLRPRPGSLLFVARRTLGYIFLTPQYHVLWIILSGDSILVLLQITYLIIIFRVRQLTREVAVDGYEDDEWGFGQVLAVFAWAPTLTEWTLWLFRVTIRYREGTYVNNTTNNWMDKRELTRGSRFLEVLGRSEAGFTKVANG